MTFSLHETECFLAVSINFGGVELADENNRGFLAVLNWSAKITGDF
jgi:hypothetical protein